MHVHCTLQATISPFRAEAEQPAYGRKKSPHNNSLHFKTMKAQKLQQRKAADETLKWDAAFMDCAMMSHNQAIFHEREDNLGCNSRLHGTQRTALLLLGSRRHKWAAYFFKNPKVVELSDARLARGCRAAVAFAVLHEHACYSLLIVFSSFGSEMP